MSDSPKPILFTIPNFITAGSGQVLFNIISRLDRAKYSPAVCVIKKGGRLDEELQAVGIPLIEYPFTIPAKPYASLLLRAWRQGQFFRRSGYKIWHSFHYADDYTEPIIAYLSGARYWIYTKKNMGWGSRAWTLRSLLASYIIADNKEMPTRFFSNLLLRRKVSIVSHGVPTEYYRPMEIRETTFRKRMGVSQEHMLIACVAHLVPVKGHLSLIEAAAQLPGVQLALAGKCDDREHFNRVQTFIGDCDMLNRVHFLGNVNNIVEFLAEMDLFVLPTLGKWRMEGCPVALLEAMACGKACIATDIPGSRDLIIHGENGWLVPPEDPQALAAAIRLLLDSPDLRARLGAAARRHVMAHYTIEQEVAAHEALYDRLIGKSRH